VLISLVVALGSAAAGPQAPAQAGPVAASITSPGPASPVTAFVVNEQSNTVTPIATATNTAGPPITVGKTPVAIAITPDGTTAYVADLGSDTVTPISTATNTAGPPITVGTDPIAIAITPASGAPAFTSSPSATEPAGTRFTFTVTTSGYPAPTITRTGRLPSGVRFTGNGDGTAAISGTPRKAAAGVYPLTLTASNANGTATQAFTLTITRAPAIGWIGVITATEGARLRWTIQASGYPPPVLAESGRLPRGVSFTDEGNGIAVIGGTPAAGSAGRYRITITATNTSGAAARHVTIVVSPRRRW
jgi:YVTN family beta-propeller protein